MRASILAPLVLLAGGASFAAYVYYYSDTLTSINTTNGNPFLSVTYTPYGAAYDLASSRPVQ